MIVQVNKRHQQESVSDLENLWNFEMRILSVWTAYGCKEFAFFPSTHSSNLHAPSLAAPQPRKAFLIGAFTENICHTVSRNFPESEQLWCNHLFYVWADYRRGWGREFLKILGLTDEPVAFSANESCRNFWDVCRFLFQMEHLAGLPTWLPLITDNDCSASLLSLSRNTRLLLLEDTQYFFKVGIVCVCYKKSQFYGLSILCFIF